MDDPIFDPWRIEEPPEEPIAEPPAQPKPRRWRSFTSREPPVRAAPPKPESPPTLESPSKPEWPPTPESPWKPESPPAHAPPPTPGPTPTRRAEPRDPVAPRARPTPLTERVRALVVPRLTSLEARLQLARHRTVLDERLDGPSPAVRFRLTPWRAPFDERGPLQGSVLEIAVDEAEGTVAARFWLDVLSPTPTEELPIDARRLGEAWIEGVLIDFVQKALREA